MKFFICFILWILLTALGLFQFERYTNYLEPKTPTGSQSGEEGRIKLYTDRLQSLTKWNLKTTTTVKNEVDTLTVGVPFTLELTFNGGNDSTWFSGGKLSAIRPELLTSEPIYIDTIGFIDTKNQEAIVAAPPNNYLWQITPIEEGRCILMAKWSFFSDDNCNNKIDSGIMKEVELYINPEENWLVSIVRRLKNIITRNLPIFLFSFLATFGTGYFKQIKSFLAYVRNAIDFLIFKNAYITPNFERMKILIANDYLNDALLQLKEITSDRHKNEVIMQQGRLSNLEQDIRQGIIDRHQAIIERNQIRDAVLGLVNAIERDKLL